MKTLSSKQASTRLVFTALALLASLGRSAWGGERAWPYGADRWRIEDGLPHASIFALALGPSGELWVGTQAGLARFDGSRFERFPDADELSMGPVFAAASQGDTTWIGTAEGLLQHQAGKLSPVPLPPVPRGTDVRTIYPDRSGDLWLGTDSGLWKRTRDGAVVAVAGPAGLVRTVWRDRQGRLWVGAAGGLFRQEGERFIADDVQHGVVFALAETSSGLWAATSRGLRHHVEPDGWRPAAVLGATSTSALAVDATDALWAATTGGTYRWQPGAPTPERVIEEPAAKALLVDRSQDVWLGTAASGLLRLSRRTLPIMPLPAELDNVPLLAVCEATDGALWLGTEGRGAVRLHAGRVDVWGPEQHLAGTDVQSLQPGADGEVWLGLRVGVQRWRRGRLEPVPAPLRGVSAKALLIDRQGQLWIGTRRDGAARWDGRVLQWFGPQQGLTNVNVRALAEDDAGRVWLGTSGGLMEIRDGRARRSSPMNLAVGRVRGVRRAAHGGIWVALADGLLASVRGERVDVLRTASASHAVVHDLIEDATGALWLATVNGLERIDARFLRRDAGPPDWLPNTTFHRLSNGRAFVAPAANQPVLWRTAQGEVLASSRTNLVRFDPAQVPTGTTTVTVSLEDTVVDGTPQPGSTLVPADHRSIEFAFRVVDLADPRGVKVRHRLAPIEDWMPSGELRRARYGRLSPGRYQFQVAAAGASSDETGGFVSLSFEVPRPYYQTVWFIGLMTAAVLSIAYGIHRAGLRRQRAKLAAAHEERTRLARELHDSLLQNLSAAALQVNHVAGTLPDNIPTEARRQMAAAEEMLRQSAAEARSLITGLRPSADTGGLAVALRVAAHRLLPDAVTVKLRTEGSPRALAPALEDHLFRMGREALTNIAKHAGARTVGLTVTYHPDRVELIIDDDGVGFDPATMARQPGHFGLQGLQERSELCHGKVTVRSAPGGGTVVHVVVPTDRHV